MVPTTMFGETQTQHIGTNTRAKRPTAHEQRFGSHERCNKKIIQEHQQVNDRISAKAKDLGAAFSPDLK